MLKLQAESTNIFYDHPKNFISHIKLPAISVEFFFRNDKNRNLFQNNSNKDKLFHHPNRTKKTYSKKKKLQLSSKNY